MQSYFEKTYVQALMTLVLLGVAAGAAAYTHYTLKLADGAYTGEVTINVQGEGEVTAVPDIGTFTFGVQAEGITADEAQAESTDAMDAIVAFLQAEGVAETDIKTANYNLNPKYRYEERVCVSGGYCPPGERVIDGYQVFQNVTVKVRNLDEAGTLISGVGERGATNISQLQFTIDDETVLEQEARAKAIADAKEKAKQLAADLDMKLGKVVGFSEGGTDGYYYGGMMARAESSEMAMDMAAPAVLPTGENEIRKTVNITYQLR
jgi:uncharacterized protein YggE